MEKYTKIVATISDLRCSVEFIQSLYDAGMNVVRMNTAHMDYEGISNVVTNTRAVSENIAILIDTKGPEIRTTPCEDSLDMEEGQMIKVSGKKDLPTTSECIHVSYEHIVRDVPVGQQLIFDDGELELVVEEKDEQYLYCKVVNSGKVGGKKSLNLPGCPIDLPAVTEKDRKNILIAIEMGIDFIAHSFVRNAKDLKEVQDLLDEHNSDIKIISKIENQEGVDNINEILENSYGIMIARGDLGIEIPAEKIPGIQRTLIRKAVKAKKPVIVATQMLHSMIDNPRPTRAEVTDIANAIYYRTDALMLSGETAKGRYPLKAVQTMARIASEAEKSKVGENDIRVRMNNDDIDVVSFLAKQTVKAAARLNTKAVITDSNTGRGVRHLAAFRGRNPIYAHCYEKSTMRLLSLSYGVFACHINPGDYPQAAVKSLIATGKIDSDDIICCMGGSFGKAKGASYLEISKAEYIADSDKASID